MITFDKTTDSVIVSQESLVAMAAVMGFTVGQIDDDFLANTPGSLRPFMQSVKDAAAEFMSVIPRD